MLLLTGAWIHPSLTARYPTAVRGVEVIDSVNQCQSASPLSTAASGSQSDPQTSPAATAPSPALRRCSRLVTVPRPVKALPEPRLASSTDPPEPSRTSPASTSRHQLCPLRNQVDTHKGPCTLRSRDSPPCN
ncbi:hypothetical protein ACCO45_007348 [Purpureocillium lilacinum]|uniref:Uncharacterized protein n=1 Tax=Purpureocillium lilacinum TaxID=33203 RepID=A0ACC4DUT8_PURLI